MTANQKNSNNTSEVQTSEAIQSPTSVNPNQETPTPEEVKAAEQAAKLAAEQEKQEQEKSLLDFSLYYPTKYFSSITVIYKVLATSIVVFGSGLYHYNWIYFYHKYRAFIIGLLLILCFLLYTILAQISVVSPGQGVVTGGDDRIPVVSPTSGYIEKFDLTTGQEVTQDQILYSFVNLDVFYHEKSVANTIEINKTELQRLQLDLALLLSLNSVDSTNEINDTIKEQVKIGSQAKDLKQQQEQVAATPAEVVKEEPATEEAPVATTEPEQSSETTPVKENTTADRLSLLLGEEVNINNGLITYNVPDNPAEVKALLNIANEHNFSLNYYKFEVDLQSLQDQIASFKIRTGLFEQEKKAYQQQLELLLRKADLLNRSRSPEVDIISNNSEISRIRLSIISAESIYLDLSNRLKEMERSFYSQLQQKAQELYERIQSLSKETSEKIGDLNLLREKMLQSSVRSPVDGQILTIEKNLTHGSFIESNQLIMTIKKSLDGAIVKAKIDARYRPFVDVGGSVEIVIDSPGYRRSFMGKISKISVDSFTIQQSHAQLNEQRFYDVEIEPINREDLDNLYEGIQSRVYVQSKKISIFSYITALFNTSLVFNIW